MAWVLARWGVRNVRKVRGNASDSAEPLVWGSRLQASYRAGDTGVRACGR